MTTALEGGHVPPIRLEYRLLIARLEAGLNAQELADRMGVNRDTISRLENGKSKPRKIVLNAWALATGVPIGWLRDGTADGQPPSDDPDVRPKGFEPPTFWSIVPDNVTCIYPHGREAENQPIGA